jgi:hypothetical protein
VATPAQPWPQVGQPIPEAVEVPEGSSPFIYADDCQPGMIMQEGFGTLAHALDRQVLTREITPQQALDSWENSGEPGGTYTPPAVPQG